MAINVDTNPFQELYVTDSPDPRTFVQLFSDFPVRHALALFRPGNVVVKGTQGSGKSMLLNLFRPQIRLAYREANAELPIPNTMRSFLGAGINLTLSGALDIGQRPLSADRDGDEAAFPLYFADFVNYFIVRDLLKTVMIAQRNHDAFGSIINIGKLDEFAETIGGEDCWFGSLGGITSFDGLCTAIDGRIASYRSFHLFNTPELSEEIERTKTAIGEPIARTAECLRKVGVVPGDTPVFVRIDQVERLYRSDHLRPLLGGQYRRVINKAIGSRDSRVSYRVGTRRYAWEDDLKIFGSDDQLEHIRDFRIIDLDEILRRKEDTKSWVFPSFAEDALIRRLRHGGFIGMDEGKVLKRVFSSTPDPSAAAKEYAKNGSADRVLKLDDWPVAWRKFLEELFGEDPLTAMLAAAWARQGKARHGKRSRLDAMPPVKSAPWSRPYWRKERVRQAVLQIAARSQQRLKWAGREHILSLSAGNISIFLSICHEVWDVFLRAERRKPKPEQSDPVAEGIHPDVQAVGIRTASRYWYEKIAEQPKGDDRRRFIDVLGSEFRAWLLADDAMSYPGHNGFSLVVDELAAIPAVVRFLDDAVGYGDLYEVLHTTKERDRRRRKKWYLSPVLSEYFQIPEAHAKEPRYVSTSDVISWVRRAEITLAGLDYTLLPAPTRERRSREADQPTLFNNDPRST